MSAPEETAEDSPVREALLNYLHQSRGFDFTGYKRSSLARRINKRMQAVGVEDYDSYIDYLEVHPDEFPRLFDTILINVTSFFRDPAAWERLRADVIPRIVSDKGADAPIRIWSAGCASGEEAYSLALVFAEAMGIEPFRERVKIFATDVDEEALNKARHAAYEARDVESIPADLLGKYLEPDNQRYCFVKDLRRAVIFGRNDLIQDAPISRIDLLACRNTLMYFNTEVQARILDRFHFALDDHGVLFLGKSETMLTYNSLFYPIDLKQRLFSKVPSPHPRNRIPPPPSVDHDGFAGEPDIHARLRDRAFDAGVVAQIIVDRDGHLASANEKARSLFQLTAHDVGRRLPDLSISYRPVELRSCIETALAERRPVTQTAVRWIHSGEETLYLDVHVVPLTEPSGTPLGASVIFIDVTLNRQLKEKLQATNEALETTNEELQSTNEELETTNEELQSTNEELETTNEELQSTNEELETMNEELQSTNEEIETVNQELQQRSNDLNRLNGFLESILASIRCGLVVVDDNLTVQTWNAMAENLWGLRAEEVRGKSLLSLEIGLPAQDLRQPIRACVSGEAPIQEVTLDSTNRRGKPIRCRVTCTPMMADGAIRGAILLMEDDTARRANETAD